MNSTFSHHNFETINLRILPSFETGIFLSTYITFRQIYVLKTLTFYKWGDDDDDTDLDPLGDAGDGEELVVLVELDGGDDSRVVDGVAAVGERGSGAQGAVAREGGEVLAELLEAGGGDRHAALELARLRGGARRTVRLGQALVAVWERRIPLCSTEVEAKTSTAVYPVDF